MKLHTRVWQYPVAKVAPLVGAWIEIRKELQEMRKEIVAPLVGAWIEMGPMAWMPSAWAAVAPLVGAWIEIFLIGLYRGSWPVAPLVGAWIEIA